MSGPGIPVLQGGEDVNGPACLFGEITDDGQRIVLVCQGGDWEIAQAAQRLKHITPLISKAPGGAVTIPATWAAATQVAHTFSGNGDGSARWVPGPRLREWILAEFTRRTAPHSPLQAEFPPWLKLREYQEEGAAKIANARKFLLCDEQGAGKTITAIAGLMELHCRHPRTGIFPCVIVTPSWDVCDSWAREIAKCAGGWATVMYGGPKRAASGSDIYITTYATARIDAADAKGPLAILAPRSVIADEIHFMANPRSKQSLAVRRIAAHAGVVIELSGTPVKQDMGDAWPALNAMDPATWPSRERFVRRYCQTSDNEYGEKIEGLDPRAEPEFRAVLLGSMRRVAKADVLDQLPPKVYSVRRVKLPGEWRKAYDGMKADMLARLPDGTELPVMETLAQLGRLMQLASSAADVETSTEYDEDTGLERVHYEVTLKAPCFPAGTPVLTDRGLVPIETVCPGDQVLTHKGRWRKVTKTMNRQADVLSNGWLTTTANHPFYTREKQSESHQEWVDGRRVSIPFTLSDPAWASADKIHGSFTAIPVRADPLPIPAVAGQPVNTEVPAFWYMIGRWLADGWLRSNRKDLPYGAVVICCGKHDKDELTTRLSATGLPWRRTENATTFVFTAGHRGLSEWILDNFGEHADAKTLPGWLFGAGPSIRESVLEGYLAADGHYANMIKGKHNGRWQASTVSRNLAVGLRVLATTLGYTTSLGVHRFQEHVQEIKGSIVGRKDTWWLEIRENNGWYTRTAGQHQWVKQRKPMLPAGEVTVYDFSVEEDHSFIAHGFVVHNCWKADALLEILAERSGQPVAVFAPSRQLIAITGQACERAGHRVGYITGTTARAGRTQAIESFQAGKLDAILATTGAGGTGITLTAAGTVVFLQRPWSLADALQAEDRCHRWGSEKHECIEIIDIVARDTVDESVRAALREKGEQLSVFVRDPRLVRSLLGGIR